MLSLARIDRGIIAGLIFLEYWEIENSKKTRKIFILYIAVIFAQCPIQGRR